MKGNFSAWDFVPAILRLIEPATIRVFECATLGFSKSITTDLIALLDSGQIGRCSFICSCYFKSNEPEAFNHLAHDLQQRGHRVAAVRNHAKVMLLETTAGDCLTIESSANLRTCHNLEQATIINDRALLEFHRGWIDEVLTTANQKGKIQ